jgi:PAS domain S-box-containing protein
MWGIPLDVIESKSDERAMQSVMDKLTTPEEFIRKVKHLYESRNEICMDELVLKDGRTFDRYSAPMFGAEGKYYGRVWYFRDITEHKQTEEALRESNERYRNLFMANIDGMLVADAATKKFRYANPAICRMLGYSEEELVQMSMADIHPKESLERVITEFEAETSGAMVTAKDLQCIKKDGQIISVSINIVPVMIRQTKYLLGIFRNTTECKSREKRN